MKIAIVVHGRFHVFDLTRELAARGHQVTVFTNYPMWAVRRHGLPSGQARGFWLEGLLSRVAGWLSERFFVPFPEAFLHRLFGRWAATRIAREPWDVVHSFSGVSEEILRQTSTHATLHMIIRASAHIRTQARILESEQRRAPVALDRPSRWMIAREEREYQLADRIYVLSSFAWNSFVSEGVDPSKLCLVPHGARLEHFRPAPKTVEARCARILSGAPLRVLFVGTLCYRKGLLDMAAIVRAPGCERFRFRLVGPVTREARGLVSALHSAAEFIPKQPERELSASHAWGDLFVFPTIEDGFAVVLAQANAAGLPILTTPNCCGPDLVREGQTGWVLPIRDPQAFVERLDWCDSHRQELAEMVRHTYYQFQPRTWADVAADFESICAESTAPSHDRAIPSHDRQGVVSTHHA